MTERMKLYPKFRTEGPRHRARVFLQCAMCEADIREIKPNESVDVTIAHLCGKCSDGGRVVVPNWPEDRDAGD